MKVPGVLCRVREAREIIYKNFRSVAKGNFRDFCIYRGYGNFREARKIICQTFPFRC
jgi:hypothetical protein